MANITNPWLNPLQRSYSQIKSKLIQSLSEITDKNGKQLITDTSEGNIFIILISLFSAIAEVLHYYIDHVSRESFLSTARKYESVVKHGKLLDYRPKAAVAATVDLVISRPVTSSAINTSLNIPKNTPITDSLGNTWLSSKDITWPANTTQVVLPMVQHKAYTWMELEGLTIPTSSPNLRLSLPSLSQDLYENGTLSLWINGESWVLVDTFAYSKPTDKHFIVDNNNGVLSIVFGDGLFGMIPQTSTIITGATCYLTRGSEGNISKGSLTTVPAIVKSNVSDAIANNPYPSGGGSDYEDFEMLKEHIPLSVKHLGVAITKDDFIGLAKTVDGVNKAVADYECGRKLNIYITPDNGTIASRVLLERVYTELKQHAPLTTWLNVKSAGVVDIILDIDVTGKKGYNSQEIQSQVLTALMDAYSIYNAEIGGNVRISDIYALIDNLPSVDYLHINQFYMKPWPKTLIGSNSLNIGNFNITEAKGSMEYLIVFESPTTYTLMSFKGGFSMLGNDVDTTTIFNDTLNGFNFGLTILDNGYKAGDKYSFVISEPNQDYEDPGFNLPIFTSSDQLTLTINEVL